MSIGAHCQRSGGFQDQLAIEVHGRHQPLPEKVHFVGSKPEVVLLFKETDRLVVIDLAGHDEPMQILAVEPARTAEFCGKDLEKGRMGDGRNRKGAFGRIVSESGALPSGNSENAHSTIPERLFPGFPGVLPLFRIAAVPEMGEIRSGFKLLEIDSSHSLLANMDFHQLIELVEINTGGLLQQSDLLLGIEGLKVFKHVGLTVGIVQCFQGSVVHVIGFG